MSAGGTEVLVRVSTVAPQLTGLNPSKPRAWSEVKEQRVHTGME